MKSITLRMKFDDDGTIGDDESIDFIELAQRLPHVEQIDVVEIDGIPQPQPPKKVYIVGGDTALISKKLSDGWHLRRPAFANWNDAHHALLVDIIDYYFNVYNMSSESCWTADVDDIGIGEVGKKNVAAFVQKIMFLEHGTTGTFFAEGEESVYGFFLVERQD